MVEQPAVNRLVVGSSPTCRALKTVANLRNRPVNGEPRESTSRGSFFSGQSWQGFRSGYSTTAASESAPSALHLCRPGGTTRRGGRKLSGSHSGDARKLTAALRIVRDRNLQLPLAVRHTRALHRLRASAHVFSVTFSHVADGYCRAARLNGGRTNCMDAARLGDHVRLPALICLP